MRKFQDYMQLYVQAVQCGENPVITDLFHRMKHMEHRGSDLRKIDREIEKLPFCSGSVKKTRK